jgi:DNA-binding NarL/FixJ family response regulator
MNIDQESSMVRADELHEARFDDDEPTVREQPHESAAIPCTSQPEAERPASRSKAVQHDAEHGQTFELTRLWDELRAGNWLFSDSFFTHERCYAIFTRVPPGEQQQPSAQQFEILTRLLLGASQKETAIDLDRSAATISSAAQAALRVLGLNCHPARPPVLLNMTAHAGCGRLPAPLRGRSSVLQPASATQRLRSVVSVERPDLEFPSCLGPAEAEVVRAVVEGASHREVARLRKTACRTVANQLATAFRKLRVSGRAELIVALIFHSFEPAAQKTADSAPIRCAQGVAERAPLPPSGKGSSNPASSAISSSCVARPDFESLVGLESLSLFRKSGGTASPTAFL